MNWCPILVSDLIACCICSTIAPSRSALLAISFMKHNLVASLALITMFLGDSINLPVYRAMGWTYCRSTKPSFFGWCRRRWTVIRWTPRLSLYWRWIAGGYFRHRSQQDIRGQSDKWGSFHWFIFRFWSYLHPCRVHFARPPQGRPWLQGGLIPCSILLSPLDKFTVNCSIWNWLDA